MFTSGDTSTAISTRKTLSSSHLGTHTRCRALILEEIVEIDAAGATCAQVVPLGKEDSDLGPDEARDKARVDTRSTWSRASGLGKRLCSGRGRIGYRAASCRWGIVVCRCECECERERECLCLGCDLSSSDVRYYGRNLISQHESSDLQDRCPQLEGAMCANAQRRVAFTMRVNKARQMRRFKKLSSGPMAGVAGGSST